MNDLKKFLKADTVEIDGTAFDIMELTAKQTSEMRVFQKESDDPLALAAWMARNGCEQLSDLSIDELMDSVPTSFLLEISTAVAALSNLGDKKKPTGDQKSALRTA